MSEEEARKLCGEDVNFEIVYINNGDPNTNGKVVNAYRADGVSLSAKTYLPQDVLLTILVNDMNR